MTGGPPNIERNLAPAVVVHGEQHGAIEARFGDRASSPGHRLEEHVEFVEANLGETLLVVLEVGVATVNTSPFDPNRL
jgi:hypothetical protein